MNKEKYVSQYQAFIDAMEKDEEVMNFEGTEFDYYTTLEHLNNINKDYLNTFNTIDDLTLTDIIGHNPPRDIIRTLQKARSHAIALTNKLTNILNTVEPFYDATTNYYRWEE